VNTTALPRTLDTWLRLLESRHPRAIDLGLERCRQVWERLGAPAPAPSSFVVAGTNGKGSTVATICALLGALGRRHGSYTTPHLHRYNERIQLDGTPVCDDVLLDLLDGDCAVITPIGLDHQEYLGPDLLSIGREKAGIIRRGRPVICGEPDPPASVLKIAADLDAPVKRLGREFEAVAGTDGVDFASGDLHLKLPRPALRGTHQVGNMATGLAAVLELLPGAARDLPALQRGLQSVSLAGRFEQLSSRPAVWVDVGHNVLGARAVASALAEARPGKRVRCVLGMFRDKAPAGVARELAPHICAWYCGGLSGSRGQTGETLAARIEAVVPPAPVRAFTDVAAALDAALADSDPDDGVLVVGSFFTAAEAARHLGATAAAR
jgi:dihydrofolate synthase/folylpolyglutamate synthase